MDRRDSMNGFYAIAIDGPSGAGKSSLARRLGRGRGGGTVEVLFCFVNVCDWACGLKDVLIGDKRESV